MWQIFVRFFSLGLVSFGGPAAHIGYFRKTFVEELGWLDDKDYASLVALSQFLPGPGSSQVGFAIGYRRGALPGAILAFIGFTLPSFLLMFLLAVSSYQYLSSDLFQGVIAGLKLLAVVVVADAAWGMFKQFCRSHIPQMLALLSTVILLLWPGNLTQLLLLLAGAIVGLYWLNREAPAPAKSGSMQLNWSALLIFLFLLLLTGPLLAHPLAELFKQFYQTGAMVFGGGHVVLPLLESQLANSIDHDRFLTGYAWRKPFPAPCSVWPPIWRRTVAAKCPSWRLGGNVSHLSARFPVVAGGDPRLAGNRRTPENGRHGDGDQCHSRWFVGECSLSAGIYQCCGPPG